MRPKAQMVGQIALDLFAETEGKPDYEQNTIDWLYRVHGITEEGEKAARRIFAAFPTTPAIDRIGAVAFLDGKSKVDGWSLDDLELVGALDPDLDYHTVWDRCWAARRGMPKEDVARLVKFDYGRGNHVFVN